MSTLRHTRDRSGAVLMELLLVIPLYVVLIGGTMWVGDLILAKERLVAADRYAAWNDGNRHRSHPRLKKEIGDLFFPRERTGGYQHVARIKEERRSKRKRWWNEQEAEVSLRVRMPKWTQGWVGAGDEFWDLKRRQETDEREKLTGRDKGGHVVVMRTPYSENYFRNRAGNWLADPCSRGRKASIWKKVTKEPWPTQSGRVRDKKHEGMDYERHGPYVGWSH